MQKYCVQTFKILEPMSDFGVYENTQITEHEHKKSMQERRKVLCKSDQSIDNNNRGHAIDKHGRFALSLCTMTDDGVFFPSQ